jgi:CBS domain-containing protein
MLKVGKRSGKPAEDRASAPQQARRTHRPGFLWHDLPETEAGPVIIGQILKSKARGVMTAHPEDSIQEIALRLASRKIGAIVIVGDSGKVAGIISERDIIRMIAEHGADALKMPASRGMTRSVVSCTKTSTIEEIMETMTHGRFRHLPVIEDDNLVGIVSIGDIVKHHTAEVELEVTAMRGYLATG